MDCSMPGFSVHHQLPELAQTHVYWVSDAIQPSHPLLSPSPPAFTVSEPLNSQPRLGSWGIKGVKGRVGVGRGDEALEVSLLSQSSEPPSAPKSWNHGFKWLGFPGKTIYGLKSWQLKACHCQICLYHFVSKSLPDFYRNPLRGWICIWPQKWKLLNQNFWLKCNIFLLPHSGEGKVSDVSDRGKVWENLCSVSFFFCISRKSHRFPQWFHFFSSMSVVLLSTWEKILVCRKD